VEGELTAETQRFAEIPRDKDLDRERNHSVKRGSASGKQGATGRSVTGTAERDHPRFFVSPLWPLRCLCGSAVSWIVRDQD
jgi:hypothetical protein